MIQEVTTYIEIAEENNKEVLKNLRMLIFALVPDAKEQFKWSRPVYATDKDFCYLKTTKKAVTLGFFDFAKVKTNSNLIEGTGKSMRHVKIKDVSEIEEFQIGKMLLEVLM